MTLHHCHSPKQVTIDGRNVKDLNLRWLRDNIGVVSLEPALFNNTIAENIHYGKLDASTEETEQEANAYNFVSELPDGFGTTQLSLSFGGLGFHSLSYHSCAAFISSLSSSGFGGFNAPDRGHHSGVCFVLSSLPACLVQEVG